MPVEPGQRHDHRQTDNEQHGDDAKHLVRPVERVAHNLRAVQQRLGGRRIGERPLRDLVFLDARPHVDRRRRHGSTPRILPVRACVSPESFDSFATTFLIGFCLSRVLQGSFILRRNAVQRGSPWRFLISGSTVMGGVAMRLPIMLLIRPIQPRERLVTFSTKGMKLSRCCRAAPQNISFQARQEPCPRRLLRPSTM